MVGRGEVVERPRARRGEGVARAERSWARRGEDGVRWWNGRGRGEGGRDAGLSLVVMLG